MSDNGITQLLNDWKNGDDLAHDRLFEQIYPVLRKIVGSVIYSGGSNLTLQTTEILHEAYVKLVGQKKADWENRSQFYAVSSRIIRRVIVDNARRGSRQKRGGDARQIPLDEAGESEVQPNSLDDWLTLDQALNKLARIDEAAARIVELRYFAGLNMDEIAAVLEMGTATAGRHWRFARAWLKNALQTGSPDAE
ncbi:MAG: sigma-70 family RNA polymerase sigma factor [Acidobacteriota bacterium]|nr:sigma-70 family RNA polymerase sigma factor [Acidobacteriota bacterium]